MRLRTMDGERESCQMQVKNQRAREAGWGDLESRGCEEKWPRALPMLHFSKSGWWKTFSALHIMRLITLGQRGVSGGGGWGGQRMWVWQGALKRCQGQVMFQKKLSYSLSVPPTPPPPPPNILFFSKGKYGQLTDDCETASQWQVDSLPPRVVM